MSAEVIRSNKKMTTIKLEDVDFDYIGLVYFTEKETAEMNSFFSKINAKLDVVVIDYENSIYEIGLAYRVRLSFVDAH